MTVWVAQRSIQEMHDILDPILCRAKAKHDVILHLFLDFLRRSLQTVFLAAHAASSDLHFRFGFVKGKLVCLCIGSKVKWYELTATIIEMRNLLEGWVVSEERSAFIRWRNSRKRIFAPRRIFLNARNASSSSMFVARWKLFSHIWIWSNRPVLRNFWRWWKYQLLVGFEMWNVVQTSEN